MIDWIDSIGKQWGAYMRRGKSGWPARSLMSRIADEGPAGAAIKTHSRSAPVGLMPKRVVGFHDALTKIDVEQRRVVEVHYIVSAKRDQKVRLAGYSNKRPYYQVLASAHKAIALLLDSGTANR